MKIIVICILIIAKLGIMFLLIINIVRRKKAEETMNKHKEELIRQRERLEETNSQFEESSLQLEEANLQMKETNAMLKKEISERVKALDELVVVKDEADRASNAKNNFLANMSHEIRTPLNGMVGMTELLWSTELSEEQEEYLDILNRSTGSLLTIINDILDYTKLDADMVKIENKSFSLSEIINDVITLFEVTAKQRRLFLKQDIEQGIPDVIFGDAVRLRQILSNLLGNALKFTAEGSIELSVSKHSVENGRIALKFTIKDTGIGILKEKQEMLFHRFVQLDNSFTKQFQGAGLGLAISKKLVEAMGGEIWLESEKGVGSKFYFTAVFGINTGEETNEQTEDSQADDDLEITYSRKKILVVEDDDASRIFMEELLMNYQMEVYSVKDGDQAIEIIKEEKFDLIFMDVQMPRMDGFLATKAIRMWESQLGRHTPIIALTAYALLGDREKCIEAGMDDYIAKPVDIPKIKHLLVKHLNF
jgi:signal transduction histidine kinase/ActR/RegA family two-component response regulator